MTHREVIEIHGKTSLFTLGLSVVDTINQYPEAEIEYMITGNRKDKYEALLILKCPDEPAEEKPKKKKTYMEDFFEKFPDAPMQSDGAPAPCLEKVYKSTKPNCALMPNCYQCWNQEMEK